MKPHQTSFLVFAALVSVALSTSVKADSGNYDDRFYITPQYTYTWPDSSEATKNGSGWQLDLGKPVSRQWNLEFGAIDYKLDYKNSSLGSFHQTAYGLNGLWFFNERPKLFSPCVLVGAGANDQRNSIGSSKTEPYGTLGLGFLTSPWAWGGAIRVGVQDLHTFGNGNYNDVIASIGLQIPLGAAPAPESEPEPAPAPAPEEPAAAPVPPPPPPAPASPRIIQLPGVQFVTNSAHLLPVSRSTLNRAVHILKANPDIDAEVAGYTDSTGKASYNLRLSQRRAEAVKQYLVRHGIDAARLSAKGYGEADPIASNRTAAGRAQNRRVELRITRP